MLKELPGVPDSESRQNSQIYRHWTPHGLMTYDPEKRTLHSPILPEGRQDVILGPAIGKLAEILMLEPEKVHPLSEIWGKMTQNGFKLGVENLSGYLKILRDVAGEQVEGDKTRNAAKLIHSIPTRGITLVHPDSAMSTQSHH